MFVEDQTVRLVSVLKGGLTITFRRNLCPSFYDLERRGNTILDWKVGHWEEKR